MRRVDILVAGGGPGGGALAALAAARGARVLLAERERFPRDKVCGEFLSAEGCAVLERLGLLGDLLAVGAARIGRCVVTDPRGHAAESRLPALRDAGREAIGVSRERLDTAILSAARSRGAEVRERCEVVAPMVEDGRVVGARLRPVGSVGPIEEVRAAVVVAADGRRSSILRALRPGAGDPSRTSRGSWFGLKAHLDPGVREPGDRIELHLFDGGYAGVGPIEGGRINLCLLVRVAALRDCGGSADRLLEARILANVAARRSLGGSARVTPWRSVGPLRFGARLAAAAGALFVGDAAGTVDPFCGEGMSNALRAAEIAVPFALDAAELGALDPGRERAYARAWRIAFAPVTRRVRWIGRLFERPVLGGAAIALLSRAGRPLFGALVAATRTGRTLSRAQRPAR